MRMLLLLLFYLSLLHSGCWIMPRAEEEPYEGAYVYISNSLIPGDQYEIDIDHGKFTHKGTINVFSFEFDYNSSSFFPLLIARYSTEKDTLLIKWTVNSHSTSEKVNISNHGLVILGYDTISNQHYISNEPILIY